MNNERADRGRRPAVRLLVAGLFVLVGCQPGKSPPFPAASGPYVAPFIRGYLVVSPEAPRHELSSAAADSGIFVPGLAVTLVDSATSAETDTVRTDLSGRFTFWGAKPGTYRICWRGRGFLSQCYNQMVTVAKLPVSLGWLPVSLARKDSTTVLFGRANMRGGLVRTLEPSIGINAFAQVFLVDLGGRPLDSAFVNNFGDYVLPLVPVDRMLRVEARLENGRAVRSVVAELLRSGPAHRVDLTFANYSPRFTDLMGGIGGKRVRTAAPGATIALSALAGDVDGDPVSYRWLLGPDGGTLSSPTGASISWVLPAAPGLYRADVIASDGRGGYAHDYTMVSSAGQDVAFSGHVRDGDGAALPDAEVEIGGTAIRTNPSGYFLTRVAEADRYVFNVRKPGYKLLSQIYQDGVEGGTWTLTRGTVQTVDPKADIDVTDTRKYQRCGTALSRMRIDPASPALRPIREDSNGYVIAAGKRDSVRHRVDPEQRCGPGIRLQVPANSLVDGAGNPPAGAVDVTLYTTDLSTPFDMPGDYTVDDGGGTGVMESYGAGHVEVTAGGVAYNLKSGATATLTIPVDPTQLSAPGPEPATMPLLTYDEKQGVWRAEGTMQRSGDAYVGKVSHLSDFNSDLVKVNQACIRIFSGDPGAGLTPLPAQYNIELTVPLGPSAPRFFSRLVANTAPFYHAFYNLPTNTDVTMAVYSTDPAPATRLYGTFIVNTGGVQNPATPNRPVPNYGACQGEVVLFDATQPVPATDAFLHGLYSFEAANLTELQTSNAALAAQFNAATANYYQNVDPRGLRTTFAGFLTRNGFAPGNHDSATYVNAADLGFGREMHCRRKPATDGLADDVACYVTNYGVANGSNADDDADFIKAANRTGAFATVAMEYSRIENPSGNASEFDPTDPDRVVKFYVYGQPGGNLANQADLDGRGARPIPQLCMVCHGGEYPAGFALGVPTFNNKASVKLGSVFIPFDLRSLYIVDGVVVNGATPYDKANQQAAFKALNRTHVLATNPGAAITDVINNMYNPPSVATQSENFVVTGWQGNAGQQAMYLNVVAPACRMCHTSRPEPAVAPFGLDLRFSDATSVIGLGPKVPNRVCKDRVMPHALATYNRFWQSLNPHQPAQLKAFGDAQAGGYGTDCQTVAVGAPLPPGVVKFGTDVQPILASNCALSFCHAGASPAGGLDMSAAVAFANLVGTPSNELPAMNRVTAGNPAQSYLIHKVNGTQTTVGGSGSKMPPGGSLTAVEIQILTKWVQDGAPP